tara:strand:- start:769 stop:1002 length:234 start_codon:yes stop_codon:yes gene_type:complete
MSGASAPKELGVLIARNYVGRTGWVEIQLPFILKEQDGLDKIHPQVLIRRVAQMRSTLSFKSSPKREWMVVGNTTLA